MYATFPAQLYLLTFTNYEFFITQSTSPPPSTIALCHMTRLSSTQIITKHLQTTQQITTDHVNKSPLNHSPNPFHNNHHPKQNHTPLYLLTHSLPQLQCRCYYTRVTVLMLLHLCYCMRVTMYIIAYCNVTELCLSQRSVFVCFV